jgi:hypothetical protein
MVGWWGEREIPNNRDFPVHVLKTYFFFADFFFADFFFEGIFKFTSNPVKDLPAEDPVPLCRPANAAHQP